MAIVVGGRDVTTAAVGIATIITARITKGTVRELRAKTNIPTCSQKSIGSDLVWRVSVDQAKSRPTDPVRIEVQFVAVPEVSGAHPGIQLDPTGLAVADEDKHIQRHLPGAQVWERVDVLLKAR
jgi:hypothetical protein